MIRPELAATLRRWAEPLWAAVGLLLAVWLFTRGGWLMQGLGILFGLTSAAILFNGIRRARFRTGEGGPGVVQLDEGRIRYFGPFYGGSVSISDLNEIEIGPYPEGGLVWRLRALGEPALLIPVDAKGGDVIYDAFATLPGIDMGHVSGVTQTPPAERITVWRRDGAGGPQALTPR